MFGQKMIRLKRTLNLILKNLVVKVGLIYYPYTNDLFDILFLYKTVNIQLYDLFFTGFELDQLDEMEKKLNKSRPKRGGKKSRK